MHSYTFIAAASHTAKKKRIRFITRNVVLKWLLHICIRMYTMAHLILFGWRCWRKKKKWWFFYYSTWCTFFEQSAARWWSLIENFSHINNFINYNSEFKIEIWFNLFNNENEKCFTNSEKFLEFQFYYLLFGWYSRNTPTVRQQLSRTATTY